MAKRSTKSKPAATPVRATRRAAAKELPAERQVRQLTAQIQAHHLKLYKQAMPKTPREAGYAASYRGAIATRSATAWGNSTSYRGGRSSDRQDQGDMRDRAREVDLNNVVGQGLLDTETDNVVAEGLSLQMKTSSPAFNVEATERFYRWLERADVTGQATASDLFRMSWREPRKDGDGGFILITRGGYPYLQYIPGDLIANPWGAKNRNQFDWRNTFDGVECDPAGRPRRFWVRDVDEHGKDTFSPIDARDFVYLSHRRSPLSVRGTTVFAPVFAHLDQLDSYLDSVTKAAIMACIFGLIEKRRNPAAALGPLGTTTNAAGEQQKAITLDRGGMLKVMGTDETMFQVQAQQPMNQTPDFIRALFRIICLAFGMPLEIGMRDLSQVNFSGGRIGLLSYYRGCRVKQDWIKSKCWDRIVFWWLSVEKRRKELGYPDAFKEAFPEDYGSFELHGAEWTYTDPLTEAQTDLLEISIGTNSPQRICEARGRDFDKIQAENAEARKTRAELGIPNVLSNVTRDERLQVTAVDANGNPIAQPANGEPGPAQSAEGDAMNPEQFKVMADAYGIVVRAGGVTPNLQDETHLRKLAGLPEPSDAVKAAWDEKGVRAPITLQQDEAAAAQGVPSDPPSASDDDSAAKP